MPVKIEILGVLLLEAVGCRLVISMVKTVPCRVVISAFKVHFPIQEILVSQYILVLEGVP